jgi:hypothetical protein
LKLDAAAIVYLVVEVVVVAVLDSLVVSEKLAVARFVVDSVGVDVRLIALVVEQFDAVAFDRDAATDVVVNAAALVVTIVAITVVEHVAVAVAFVLMLVLVITVVEFVTQAVVVEPVMTVVVAVVLPVVAAVVLLDSVAADICVNVALAAEVDVQVAVAAEIDVVVVVGAAADSKVDVVGATLETRNADGQMMPVSDETKVELEFPVPDPLHMSHVTIQLHALRFFNANTNISKPQIPIYPTCKYQYIQHANTNISNMQIPIYPTCKYQYIQHVNTNISNTQMYILVCI